MPPCWHGSRVAVDAGFEREHGRLGRFEVEEDGGGVDDAEVEGCQARSSARRREMRSR